MYYGVLLEKIVSCTHKWLLGFTNCFCAQLVSYVNLAQTILQRMVRHGTLVPINLYFRGSQRFKNRFHFANDPYVYMTICRPRWLSWMRRPTGDQEVAGSTPAKVGNILSWRLIMKYFLRSFSPFCWFKKGSCQFLAKECAQYWLTA